MNDMGKHMSLGPEKAAATGFHDRVTAESAVHISSVAGYSGEYCEQVLPSVCQRASPCGIHGKCVLTSSLEEFRCICSDGWIGTFSQMDVSEHINLRQNLTL